MSYLDCDVIRYNNRLKTDVHQKPTDCHPYLDYTSAHPSHFKSSIPYSQALRLRRICKDNNVLKERIKQYTNYFVACGYKTSFVKKEMERVLEVRRKDTLVKKEKNKDNRIPLVVTYHPDLPPVGQIINKHWPMLQCLKAEPLEKNLTYSTQLLANLLGSSTWLNAQNVAYSIAGKQKHH